jgi:hypothetical protein
MGKDTEHMDGDLMERNALWMRLSSVHRYYVRMFDVAKCTKSRGSARYQIRGTKRLLQVGGWYCVGDH